MSLLLLLLFAALLLLLLLLLSCCAESVYWAVKQRLNEAKKSISWPYVRAKNFWQSAGKVEHEEGEHPLEER